MVQAAESGTVRCNVSVRSLTEYKCDICSRSEFVPVDQGIPEGWAILNGTVASNGEPYHVCDTCIAPIKAPLEAYRKNKFELLKIITAIAQGKIEPTHMAAELLRDTEDSFI